MAESRNPWQDNKHQVTKPVQLQQSAQGTLRDYGITSVSSPAPQWTSDMRDQYKQSVKSEQETGALPDFDMQVFISTGMPDGVLRSLFRQSLDEGGKRVRFVVRGFEPQKIGELIHKLRMHLPDPYKDEVLVEVDPNAFRSYGVTSVPVYLVKNKDKWFSIRGAVSLDGARAMARKGGNYKAGESYAVAEPDILSVIEDRAKKYDWEGAFARARTRAAQNIKPSFDLPTVVKESTDYFVPTFTVPEDVTGPGPDGKGTVVLAKAGQTFNLLQHTRLQVPVIAIDAGDERQIQLVRGWLKRPEYRAADVFIVGSMTSAQSGNVVMEELVKKFNRPVFPLVKRLGDRFGIQAVPAIVEQEGDRLRIRYFNPQTKG
ncbi:TrbC family F-type conjugative pilus assembly protein [Acidovorax sp. LjRoot194]|uniref:TrbC family F-type conjugative pilus assembly protein n=2 Tax=unclassified Acidovorax TaxID=2684926 RepID=UPI003ECFA25D